MNSDEAIKEAYRLLLWYHMQAARGGDEDKRKRIFAAIEVFCEVFPTQCAEYEALYSEVVK